MSNRTWRRGEKQLLIFSVGVPLLLLGLSGLYEWNNRVPSVQIPETPLPAANAFEFYKQATLDYVAPVHRPPQFKFPVDIHLDSSSDSRPPLFSKAYNERYLLQRKQAYLARNASALQSLRRGLSRPYVQPPERDTKEVIDYQVYRNLARLLLVQSHSHAQTGNWDAAADTLLDILHFGYDIARGGPLRAALVGNAIRATAERDFWIVLPNLSAGKAREAAKKLELWQTSQVTAAQALEEDKRSVQSLIVGLIRSRDFRPLYVAYGCIDGCNVPASQYQNDLDDLPRLLKLRLAWMNKARLLHEHARCMDWQIAKSRKLYPARAKSWPFPESDDGIQQMIYPKLVNSPINFDLRSTLDGLLMTGLALHAYHLEMGRYPVSLKHLVPEYLSQVPSDPFSNSQEFHYRLAPIRYLRGYEEKPGVVMVSPIDKTAPPPAPAAPGAPQVHYVAAHQWLPYKLYSSGFNSHDDGGIPIVQDVSFTTRSRYQIKIGSEQANTGDIVGGVNH